MGKKIVIKFECVACGNKTPTPVLKPTAGTPKTQWTACENCESLHLVQLRKQLGAGPNGYLVSVIDVELTKIGIETRKKRAQAEADKLAATVKPKIEGEFTGNEPVPELI